MLINPPPPPPASDHLIYDKRSPLGESLASLTAIEESLKS